MSSLKKYSFRTILCICLFSLFHCPPSNAEEISTAKSTHKCIQNFIIGDWVIASEPYIHSLVWTNEVYKKWKGDFIKLSSDGTCHFKLFKFKGKGKAKYDEAYAGYHMIFKHNEKEHVLIFTADDESWDKPQKERLAFLFIGHDSKPRIREIDCQAHFRRVLRPKN